MKIYSSLDGSIIDIGMFPQKTKNAYGEIYLSYDPTYLTYKLFSTSMDDSFTDIYNVKYPTPNNIKTSTYYHFNINPKVTINFITLFTPITYTNIENLTYSVNDKEYTDNTKSGKLEFYCKFNSVIKIPNETNFGPKNDTNFNELNYRAKVKIYREDYNYSYIDLSASKYESVFLGGNGFYILDGDVEKTITQDTEFKVAILPKFIYLSPAYVGNSIGDFIKKDTYKNLYTISSGNNEGIRGTVNGGNSGSIDNSITWGAGMDDRGAGTFSQMYAENGWAATSEYRYSDRGHKEARRFGVTPIIMSLLPRTILVTSSPSSNDITYNGTSFIPRYSADNPFTAGKFNPSKVGKIGTMIEKAIAMPSLLGVSNDFNYQQNITNVSAYWLPKDGYEEYKYTNLLNNFSYSTLLYGETSKNNRGGTGVWASPHLWNGPYAENLKKSIGINQITEHKYLQHQVLIGSASGGSGEDRDHQIVFEFSTITINGICAECYYKNAIESKKGLNNPNIQDGNYYKGFIIALGKFGGHTSTNYVQTGLFRINTLDMTEYEKSRIKTYYELS